jgi:hypothetical protein
VNPSTHNSHCAKYLILVGPKSAPRALLFNREHRYLAEMIDDRFTVERLMRASRVCAKPTMLALEAVVPPEQLATGAGVQCFELDA